MMNATKGAENMNQTETGYMVYGKNHDMGAQNVSVYRDFAISAERSARLMTESGYRKVTTRKVKARS